MINKIKTSLAQTRLARFTKEHERYLVPSMLIGGVLVDFVTFRTIQLSTAFSILLVYTLIAGAAIIFVNVARHDRHAHQNSIYRYALVVAPLVIQFTFGALLSASMVFYWFSGALSVSWPLIIVIALIIASNDVLREHYLRPTIQLAVYFFILFSLSTLILPFVFNSISAWVFFLAAALSLALIYIYIQLLTKAVPDIQSIHHQIRASIIIIFLSMISLYSLNIIPPIPLSLREAGVYHHVSRSGTEYLVQEESTNFFDKILPGQIIHLGGNDPAYVFTSIFAPADLNTRIVHNWKYYNENTRKWVSEDRLSYTISGGRDDGYRGFSFKRSLDEGRWMVSVETERGQVLGRVKFSVSGEIAGVELIETQK
jgi:hypothetical protein